MQNEYETWHNKSHPVLQSCNFAMSFPACVYRSTHIWTMKTDSCVHLWNRCSQREIGDFLIWKKCTVAYIRRTNWNSNNLEACNLTQQNWVCLQRWAFLHWLAVNAGTGKGLIDEPPNSVYIHWNYFHHPLSYTIHLSLLVHYSVLSKTVPICTDKLHWRQI